MAGAINLFRQYMRRAVSLFTCDPTAHRGDVARSLAGIDLAQRRIALRHRGREALGGNLRRCDNGRGLGCGSGRRGRVLGERRLAHPGQRRRSSRGRHGVGRNSRRQLADDLSGRCRNRFASAGERMRARRESRHVGAPTMAGFEIRDQRGQYVHGLAQGLKHRQGALLRAIEDAVQQIFDGPGELAERARIDHAAAALERVERAPHGRQRFGFQRIVIPDRELLANLGHLLGRLIDEQPDQLRIGRGLRQHSVDVGGGLEHRGFRDRELQAAHVRGIAGRARRRDEQGAGVGAGSERGHRRQHTLGCVRERIQADARIVEHVPGIAAPGLQCLDVVLEADDGIGQTIEIVRRECQAAAGLHHAPEVLRDVLDDVDRSRLAEHQQAGLDAAHELRPTIEARGIERAADVLRNVFLDARQIHHALAQHRALNLVEILILRVALAFAIGGLFSRQDQTDQLVVQVILDVDEPCGHLYQRALAAFFLARHDGLEPPRGFLHAQAQLAEAEYAERIADFLKQTDLRREFLGLAAAAAHEDVEHILDLGQILADRRGHRMHELDRGCGKILALLLDRLIDRQQFGETE